MGSRLVRALLAIAIAVSLAACEPYPPAPEGVARVEISVDAFGTATSKVFLDWHDHDEAEYLAFGQTWSTVFGVTDPQASVHVNSNGVGNRSADSTVHGVFEPGDAATLTIDTVDAVGWSVANGVDQVDLSIRLPAPVSGGSLASGKAGERSLSFFGVSSPEEAPAGEIVFVTYSQTAWVVVAGALALVALTTLVIAATAAIRRRRELGFVMSAAALAASVLALALSPYMSARAATVAGNTWMPLSVVDFLTFAMAMVPLLAIGCVIAVTVRTSRYPVRFVPSPGWPPCDSGWLPDRDWRPPEGWPPGLRRWSYLQAIPRRYANRSHTETEWREAREWMRAYRRELKRAGR